MMSAPPPQYVPLPEMYTKVSCFISKVKTIREKVSEQAIYYSKEKFKIEYKN